MSTTEAAPVRTEPRQLPGAEQPPAEQAPAPSPPPAAPSPSATRPPRRRPPAATVRVSRVVLRRLDPWTVLKVSSIFYLAMFVVVLTAGVLLWVGANAVGVIENVESFMSSIGFTDFRFLPGQLLRTSAIVGLVMVVAGTAANVLMAVLYNLISDVVGGIHMTLSDDEPKGRRRI